MPGLGRSERPLRQPFGAPPSPRLSADVDLIRGLTRASSPGARGDLSAPAPLGCPARGDAAKLPTGAGNTHPRHCEFRTGLRPTLRDETARSRHCEQSEAIQGPRCRGLSVLAPCCCPWIASSQELLAMTGGVSCWRGEAIQPARPMDALDASLRSQWRAWVSCRSGRLGSTQRLWARGRP